jgi:hypothetical protein
MNALKAQLGINEKFTKEKRQPKEFNKVKDNIPLIEDYNFMADLLVLPEDKKKNKYCLVVVDLANDDFDIEPIQNKDSSTVLDAIIKMFKRKYIKKPYASMRTDKGKEFQGMFHKYLYNESILHKIANPGRHNQMANVENLNRTLGRLFNGYMNAMEEKLGKEYYNWTDIIGQVRDGLNKIRHKELSNDITTHEYPVFDNAKEVIITNKKKEQEVVFEQIKPKYKVGDLVYIKLDEPENALGNKQNTKQFREGDRRWDFAPHTVLKILFYTGKINYRYIVSDMPHVSYNEYQLRKSTERVELKRVKSIIGKKSIGRKIHYKVWWAKELRKQATWEPKSELIKDIPDLLKEYDDSH